MNVSATLVEFCRVVAAARAPADVMQRLVDVASITLGAPAATVLAVTADDRLQLAASRGLPTGLASWSTGADTIGAHLGDRLLAALGGTFTHAVQFPLVADGDLYGVLVVLGAQPIAVDPEARALAEALVDLAAIAAGRAAAHDELARSYAELRSSRDALARTERLRVLGQLAAGVSHDVNNLLNPIGLQLELLRRRVERGDTDAVRETIVRLQQMVGHGVDVVERLRDFSRQAPELESESVDLAATVSSAIELSRTRVALHPEISLRATLGPVPRVCARASELVTAVVNLIANATDALGEHGTISVATATASDGAWVEVADDGPGMAPDAAR